MTKKHNHPTNYFHQILDFFKKYYYPIIIALTAIIFSLNFLPYARSYSMDIEIFRYIGYRIFQGEIPYTDVFDHKPPIIYFIAGISNFFGYYGFWLIGAIFLTISSLLLFKLFNSKLNPHLSFVLTIIYVILTNEQEILELGLYTRHFASFFLIFLIYSLYKKSYILAGAILAIIFQTQTNSLPGAFFLVLAFFFHFNKNFDQQISFKKFAKQATIGFIVPNILLLLWLATNGALKEYYYQAYYFNTHYYTKQLDSNIIQRLLGSLMLLAKFHLILPLFSIIAFLTYKFLQKKQLSYLFLSLAILVEIAATSTSGRHVPAYFIPLLSFIMVGILFVVTDIKENIKEKENLYTPKNYKLLATSLIPILLILPILQKTTERTFFELYNNARIYFSKTEGGYINKLKEQKELFEVISDVKGKDKQLLVNPDNSLAANINIINKTSSPSKFFYIHFADQKRSSDPKILEYIDIYETVKNDLEKHKTKYVLTSPKYTVLYNIVNEHPEYFNEKYKIRLKDPKGEWILYQRLEGR